MKAAALAAWLSEQSAFLVGNEREWHQNKVRRIQLALRGILEG
jgi:hypothetical protein